MVYNVADIFVLCSLREGFGRVCLEAMAAKLPVIARRTDNTEWILGNDNNGLIDMTVENELADTTQSMLSNKDFSDALGIENYNRVYEKFDWNSLTSDYINMYKKIQERGKNKSQNIKQ